MPQREVKMKKSRTGTAIVEISGTASIISAGEKIVVTRINKDANECSVRRPDGTCSIVCVPLGHVQFDPYVVMLEDDRLGETYAHNYNKNCVSRHEVRLIGHNQGKLDNIRIGLSQDTAMEELSKQQPLMPGKRNTARFEKCF